MRRIVNGFVLITAMCAVAFAWLWFGLPDVADLAVRARVPSSRIVDRHGTLLYELVDPRSLDAGRHMAVPLAQMPLYMRAATIAIEDASFYENVGIDLVGIVRALWINLRGGEVLTGGSTITQQLARQLLFDEGERQ